MKKLVAVAVVLAFVAGGAFAISFSGDVMAGAVLMGGTTADGEDDILGGGEVVRARLAMEASNADNTFGFLTRFQAGGFDGMNAGVSTHTALAWWQPIPMFWLGLGFDGNGLFAQQGDSRWGFYREHGDVGMVNAANAWGGGFSVAAAGWSFNHSFYGGFAEGGVAMTIRPIPELSINVGLPVMAGAVVYRQEWGFWDPTANDGAGAWIGWQDAGWATPFNNVTSHELGDIFSALHIQGAFAQPWGSVALTYRGSAEEGDDGSMFVYVNLTSIDNLNLNFGLGFHLVGDDPLIGIGVMANYDISPEFGLRARFQFGFDTADYGEHNIMLDVLPFFALTSNVRVFCSVGISMDFADGESAFNFHLAPHIVVGGEWAPRFFAGFRLESDNDWEGDSVMNWSVPIGLVVNF